MRNDLPDWLPLSGRPLAAARVIDADVSTVTAAADKVLYVEAKPPWIMHLEVQASRDVDLPGRLHVYNTLLHQRHRVPVQTVAVLLRPAADSANLTGEHSVRFPGEEPYVRFGYSIVRIWQQPLERMLSAGPGLLPLSLLCDEAVASLPKVLSHLHRRFETEVPRPKVEDYWTSTLVLAGLRFDREEVSRMVQGIRGIEESSFYQLLVEKGLNEGIEKGLQQGLQQGRLDEAHNAVIRLGTEKFGTPNPETLAKIQSLNELQVLHDLEIRVLKATSWQDLLGDR